MMTKICCSILVMLTTRMATGFELRTWTDEQNRTVEATLLRSEGQNVILKLNDGREVVYPLGKLSATDRTYITGAAGVLGAVVGDKIVANFDSAWPERISFSEDPEVNVIEENATDRKFIYESASYRYVCDVRLAKNVVKDFAMMFEATHLYCRSLPLGLNGGDVGKAKRQISLFEEFDDFIRAGGLPGSAGVFDGRSGLVLVPLSSLGVKPVGKTYMLDRGRNNVTLTHELAHQLTAEAYFVPGARGWLSEGIAEYIALTPYRSGSFNIRTNLRDLPEYVTGYGTKGRSGRALGTRIRLPSLKTFMLQNYAEFSRNASLNYGASLLLVISFIHLDGEGDGKRLKAFLKALHAGKEGQEALNTLLDGRSYQAVEQELTKAWKSRGIDLGFDQ